MDERGLVKFVSSHPNQTARGLLADDSFCSRADSSVFGDAKIACECPGQVGNSPLISESPHLSYQGGRSDGMLAINFIVCAASTWL